MDILAELLLEIIRQSISAIVAILTDLFKKKRKAVLIILFVIIVFALCFLWSYTNSQKEQSEYSEGNTTSTIPTEIPPKMSTSGPVTDVKIVVEYASEIQSVIEKSFSSLGFEKGSITTETDTMDTSTMSAEIYDFRLGDKAYLYKNRDTGKYTSLFIPIHFSISINQTLTFNKQTIDDIVGYAWIELYELDEQGNLQYKIYNYLTAQYFTSEELLYDYLCGNGYIVEEIVLSR